MILLTVAFVFTAFASIALAGLFFVYAEELEPVEVVDAGVDAGSDAGVDGGFDAGVDAGTDAGVDAGHDAGVDAGPPRRRRRGRGAWWQP